jgi:DNA replication protein DnaC
VLTQATIDKMHAMKLTSLAETFERVLRSPEFSQMSFEERVGMMIDAEHDAREQRKLTRRLQWARLRHQASLEDVDWQSPRGLDRQVVLSLGRCAWLRDHQNLLITGPTGVGKSWLACAFAQRACRSGHSAYYARAPRLHQDLLVARADGSYGRMLARFAKTELLVIDDFALTPLKDQERRDLLEILEDRHERASTLLTSQLPVKAWHEAIGEPTLADAICDRLVHAAHKIELKGASLRERKAKPGRSAKAAE